MKNYDDFTRELNGKIKSDDEFYYELLITVIKNPRRYTGIFRVSNARTKLIQNVTQSREIKFGDFMEDIVTWYIADMGCENLDKRITPDLEADQLFADGNTVYLIEQKIRDDHDSTKKRGQYDNFRRKYAALRELYPGHDVTAVMWFIDDSLRKNRKYYAERAEFECCGTWRFTSCTAGSCSRRFSLGQMSGRNCAGISGATRPSAGMRLSPSRILTQARRFSAHYAGSRPKTGGCTRG
ncbi:MAG: hypothetical protein IJR63_01235 [Synergistaceae bacterium]|nr:hypothetical protein [Synergistaceae bacterium]